jgi:DNA-3-methyladenine glycosylase I
MKNLSSVSSPLNRCSWCLHGNEAYITYHDKEWGVPIYADVSLFEFLLLETAQAGLSWATILNRREGFRQVFCDFNPEEVARMTERDVERLVTDERIIRHRKKIESAINNARAFVAVQEEFGSFNDYIWGFVDNQPVQNTWRVHEEIPVSTPLSDTISKDLKKRSFAFIGKVTVYAYMQAVGLVNDHIVNCFRYRECAKLA